MSYNINQLAKIAEISVRTLHHYDDIGLLTSSRNIKNQYRIYEEKDLLKLQQILFFRELDFKLEDIKKILENPKFDIANALKDHKQMILLKRKRLDELLKTIDKTINKVTNKKNMKDKELYGGFTKEEIEKYQEEAKEKWGDTEAYKQSTERVKKMGKDGLNKVLEESGKLTMEIAYTMKKGLAPESTEVQKLIARHYDGLRAFYEPTKEIYAGLAKMYVEDERFKKNYGDVAQGLAQFMQDGMLFFINEKLQ